MDPLVSRVVARYAAKSYRVDRSAVRKELRAYNDPSVIEDSKRNLGGYTVAEYKLVPIRQINVPKKWHTTRGDRVQEAIDEGKALPPVELSLEGSRYEISDGIHRTNMSLENGFTHVPAIISSWVETPEAFDRLEDSEKREVGRWVQLHEPIHGRTVGWIEEYLTAKVVREGRRHVYSIALVKRGDTWPDYVDLMDTEFTAGRVRAPSWAQRLKEELGNS